MSSSKYSYPHPILGNFDDILPGLTNTRDKATHCEDELFHYYTFDMTIEDETILGLIAQGKAKYAIHYKCKSSRFEGHEYGTSSTLELKIPRKRAIGRIDFNLSIIATKDFTYKNPSANPLFMECSFDIHPNDPLVLFPDEWDDLELSFQPLKHYSSILVPVQDENLEGNEISVEMNEKIEVHISKEAYQKLKNVKMPEYEDEIKSTYVQTALMTALFKLFYENDSVSDIRKKDEAWVQAIVKRMDDESNMPTLQEVFDSPTDEIPLLVQKLLQFPMGGLLNKISNCFDEPLTELDYTEE